MAETIKITLVKSIIGSPEKHRSIVKGMGLKRLNKSVILNDTPAVRGMINKVSHLVRAEEISQ